MLEYGCLCVPVERPVLIAGQGAGEGLLPWYYHVLIQEAGLGQPGVDTDGLSGRTELKPDAQVVLVVLRENRPGFLPVQKRRHPVEAAVQT